MSSAATASEKSAVPITWKMRGWRLLKSAVTIYVGVVLVLMFLENWLVYHPFPIEETWKPPADNVIEEVWVSTGEGERIHGLWFPEPKADGALLYCHGNGGNVSHRVGASLWLAKNLNKSVLAFDYPGFGKSEGRPTEAGCYAAADAAYDWLSAKVPAERIVLFGKSLGGGVAVELATRRTHHALVLAKTFTSIPDVGQARFPWIPARWLMRNRFDNLAKIGRCPRPIFIMHGDCDSLIPFRQAEELFAAAPSPKRFFPIVGGVHDGSFPPDFLASLNDFLREIDAAPAPVLPSAVAN